MTRPGRPTLYKPEYAERARELCVRGGTNRILADSFDVARSTIDQWIATVPELGDAVREGRAIADLAVVQSLFARATGYWHKAEKVFRYRGEPRTATYNVHVPPDVGACIFWLRNRRPQQWREKPVPSEQDDAAWPAEPAAAAQRVPRGQAG